MSKGKVCLAYSGGLDTSCILKYLLVSLFPILLYAQCFNGSISFLMYLWKACACTGQLEPPSQLPLHQS